jgi:hypothetical protein
MRQKQILRLQPASRLEPIGGEHSGRVQDCKQRSECLATRIQAG